ncbi:uncharacterized protein LOC116245170 [Nymphaea colorata]|uniref:uncharacterized protein LOC116245170 n=1 Tax=Nymphaea colorata TaxID=210225 RepID=UPI00129ECA44|nr:uncharacterized protein LOC116245170 [Nymphaea colorata]
MKLPSEFDVDVKVMLFEEKCAPRWEEWLESGCLIIQFKDTKESNESEALDQIWEYLLFGLVGNQLDRDIIGICLSKHEKQTLVEVWLRRKDKRVLIGKRIEELIERDLHFVCTKLKKPIRVVYKDHKVSMEVFICVCRTTPP